MADSLEESPEVNLKSVINQGLVYGIIGIVLICGYALLVSGLSIFIYGYFNDF